MEDNSFRYVRFKLRQFKSGLEMFAGLIRAIIADDFPQGRNTLVHMTNILWYKTNV